MKDFQQPLPPPEPPEIDVPDVDDQDTSTDLGEGESVGFSPLADPSQDEDDDATFDPSGDPSDDEEQDALSPLADPSQDEATETSDVTDDALQQRDALVDMAGIVASAFAPFGVDLDVPPPRTGAISLTHGNKQAIQRLTPDGTNSFTSPDASTVTVTPDGAIVASTGVEMRASTDGDIEATTPDGYKVTASPKGDMWVEAPGGDIGGLGRDGTVSIADAEGWSVVSSADGTSSTTTMRNPDGTTVSSSTDGTRSIGRPDGTETTVHPDGTVVHTMPDGSVAVREPDGEVSVTTPDGVTTVTQADGDVYIHYPDGTLTGPLMDEPGLISVNFEPFTPIAEGAAESVRDTVTFLWSVSPLREAIDPQGYQETVDGLVNGLRYAVTHPVEALMAMVDVETWKEDPLRALGKLLPDLLLGLAARGSRSATKLDDLADAAKAGDKVADSAETAKGVERVDDAGDTARAGDNVANDGGTSGGDKDRRADEPESDDAGLGNKPGAGGDGPKVPSSLRSQGLTTEEAEELARYRTDVFNLPPRPTKGKTSIVGVLVLESGERLPLMSGKFGGPWGGTHRGHIPRGEGSGFSRHSLTHVEGHAAAVMHQRGIKKATLLIEKMPCKGCDHPTKRPNITAMLPRDALLTVVDSGAAGTYRSVH